MLQKFKKLKKIGFKLIQNIIRIRELGVLY